MHPFWRACLPGVVRLFPKARQHRKIELRPIDARLNLPEGKASPLLEEFSQLFCVEKAFGVGARQFEVVFGQKLSVDVLEDINRRMGDQAERFLATLPKPPAKEEGELMVLTGDGKGVPLVKKDAQQVPVFEEKNERPGNRRMATLACTYTVDRHVRTPEQIVAALMHDDTVPPPADRPEACFKRYFGSFAEPGHDGIDAVPSAYGAFAWTAEEAAKRWRPGQPVQLFGKQCRADALSRIPASGLSNRLGGDRRGLPTHHQRPHGTGRHALDTTGRRSDAQRPSRLRLERVGRVPQLATIGKQKNKPPERRPGGKLHWIQSMKPRGRTVTPLRGQVVRASSIIENINSRLRSYFFLRRELGSGYLELLQFFLNHRRFLRSEHSERVDKSPAELLTGKPHPHWLEMLGYSRSCHN